MTVLGLLNRHDAKIISVRPEDTVETAATLLTSNNIGALPVRDGDGGLVGVLSERDIVHALAETSDRLREMLVESLMTRDVITCRPADTVKEVMEIMRHRHIRHLPVVEEGKLVGVISQRDVMENRLEQAELEKNVLRDVALASR